MFSISLKKKKKRSRHFKTKSIGLIWDLNAIMLMYNGWMLQCVLYECEEYLKSSNSTPAHLLFISLLSVGFILSPILVLDQCSHVALFQMTGSNEYKLNQGPEDSISAVKFSPSTAQFLLVSSWDSTVRLYDVVTNTIRMKYQHTAPVLDCAFYVSRRL